MNSQIKQIEKIFAQGSGQQNEDNLACSGNLFGVFDGASSLTPELYSGKTGAWWASHLVSSEFNRNDAPLLALGKRANQRLRQEMLSSGVDSENKLQCWSTSAAVVRLQNDNLEWFQSGDSQILAIYADGSFKLLTRYLNHDSQTLKQLKTFFAQGVPAPHCSLRPQVENVRRQMNQSYGILNGEDAALDFSYSGVTPLQGIQHLLIFTDGLFPPVEDPDDDPDFTWLTECYLQGGLAKVKTEIRQLEEQDPDCCRFPRFKRHDDIAAFALSLV